jgi:HPt (histidine-containing phosphotransfer) domain-containing protein
MNWSPVQMAEVARAESDAEMERELLAHYLASAEERLDSVRQAAESARGRPADAAALDGLRRVLHKIAGNAGTYGFPVLGRSARALEKQALAARDAPPAPAALFAGTDGFLREMEAAFSEARARPPGVPRAGEAPEPADAPAAAGATQLSAIRDRLIIAVLGDAQSDDAVAAAAGAALAAAGTHLLTAGADGAGRGFRRASDEGLVFGLVAGPRGSASRFTDLPLAAAAPEARCALLAAISDGALLVGGGGEALAHAGSLLSAGKPVVAVGSTGGAAAALAGRELGGARVGAAADADEAVAELLALLAAAPR